MRSRSTASRRALVAAWAEQDKGMEVVAMSREISTYEAMGGTYTEIDGVFYPDISIEEIKPDGDFGVTNLLSFVIPKKLAAPTSSILL